MFGKIFEGYFEYRYEVRKLYKPYLALDDMDFKTLMVKSEDLEQIKRDLEIIKDAISPESELTDWAKKELANARNTPEEEYIGMEDIEKEFLKNAL